MMRRNAVLILPLFISLAFLGAWLIGLIGEEKHEEISGLQMLSSLLGFFIFIGSLAGLVYFIGQQKRPMSQAELAMWEILRRKGRRFYIQRAALKGFILGVLSSSLAILLTKESGSFAGQQLGVFIILVLIITFAGYYTAVRTWDSNERAYKAMSNSRRNQNL